MSKQSQYLTYSWGFKGECVILELDSSGALHYRGLYDSFSEYMMLNHDVKGKSQTFHQWIANQMSTKLVNDKNYA